MKNIVYLMTLLLLNSLAFAQDDLDSNYAFYEGQTLSYLLEAPEDWVLNLDDANFDGLSACFYPDDMTYFDNKLCIKVWIFKLDSLSFDEFISSDSSYYLNTVEDIEFKNPDTLKITEKQIAVILRVKDPGALYTLAAVAYIDAVSEIIIYELNISGRQFDLVSQVKFKEALEKFSFVKDVFEDN